MRTVAQTGDGAGVVWLLVLVAGFVFGLVIVYRGFDGWRRKRAIQDTPTETVQSAAVGRTELTGTVRSAEETIEAPFTDEEAVYATWQIEELTHDDGGTEWETIGENRGAVDFQLEDDTGSMLVRAGEADPEFAISAANETTVTVDAGQDPPPEIRQFFEDGWHHGFRDTQEGSLQDYLQTAKAPERRWVVGDGENERRYTQRLLPVDHEAYVLGAARNRGATRQGTDEQLLEIGAPTEGLFLISDRIQADLTAHYADLAPKRILLGIALSAGCLFVLLWTIGGL